MTPLAWGLPNKEGEHDDKENIMKTNSNISRIIAALCLSVVLLAGYAASHPDNAVGGYVPWEQPGE